MGLGCRTSAAGAVLLGLVACSGGTAVSAPSPTSAPTPTQTRTATPRAVLRPTPSTERPAAMPTPAAGALTLAVSTVGSTVLARAVRLPSAGPGQGPITVALFNGSRTHLVLHAGALEPASAGGWRYGARIAPAERSRLVAAINGGFKMKDAHGGWSSEGRTVVPLVRGAASVVIYRDGGTDIGRWGSEVPAAGRQVVSVRQNLDLLVDHGTPQQTHPVGQRQLDQWWGHAFQGAPLIARSALGVTVDGSLVWAAGTRITVAALAAALVAHGAVRALELDVNAPLVRGFLFAGPARVTPSTPGGELPLVLGQRQLAVDPATSRSSVAPHCDYVRPCNRDFFTVLAR